MTLTKERADPFTGAALYSLGGNRGHGGEGTGCQKYKCSHCKMANHATEACGKRMRAEKDKIIGNTNR